MLVDEFKHHTRDGVSELQASLSKTFFDDVCQRAFGFGAADTAVQRCDGIAQELCTAQHNEVSHRTTPHAGGAAPYRSVARALCAERLLRLR